MPFTLPTIQEFKDYYFRDFPFQPTPDPIPDPPIVIDIDSYVQDMDIQKAFDKADNWNNDCFFSTQKSFTIGFMLISAHYLAMGLRASSQGISGQFDWGASSKSVGSVSISTSIPQRILDNPEFAYLAKTNYGAEYLMMILPQLSGVIYMTPGGTQP